MTELKIDVKPTGTESAIVYTPFDEAVQTLGSQGFRLITLAENAALRIQQGADSEVSKTYNRVAESAIYTPGESPILTRNSPILQNPKEATQAHRNGNEFYITDEQIEIAREDSVVLPNKTVEIPTNRFGDDKVTVYAFGGEDEARAYGEFLREAGIKEMPVWIADQDYVNQQDQSFARGLWFGRLDGWSVLVAGDRDLVGAVRTRGVKIAGEAARENYSDSQNSELYTSEQIRGALDQMQMSGLETQLLKTLNQKS